MASWKAHRYLKLNLSTLDLLISDVEIDECSEGEIFPIFDNSSSAKFSILALDFFNLLIFFV